MTRRLMKTYHENRMQVVEMRMLPYNVWGFQKGGIRDEHIRRVAYEVVPMSGRG